MWNFLIGAIILWILYKLFQHETDNQQKKTIILLETYQQMFQEIKGWKSEK